MAFETDCGVSTVLEENRVTSTAGFLVPGEFRTPGHLAPTVGSQENVQVGGKLRCPKAVRNSTLKT